MRRALSYYISNVLGRYRQLATLSACFLVCYVYIIWINLGNQRDLAGKEWCKNFPSRRHLTNFIWAHRAGFGQGLLDGSEKAEEGLLRAGIHMFDIDVSYVDDIFYVAHPEVLRELPTKQMRQASDVQTLPSFLQHLAWAALEDLPGPPLVTIEPKFESVEAWGALVALLQDGKWISPSCVAIIVNSVAQLGVVETILAELVPTLPLISIAIAYRSAPKTPQDFSFAAVMAEPQNRHGCCMFRRPALSPHMEESFHLGVRLLRRHIFKPNPNPNPNPNPDLGVRLLCRHIFMPDSQLLGGSASFAGRAAQSTRRVNPGANIVVSWLVDTAEELAIALRQGVDGVITNFPIRQLATLERLYDDACAR